MERLLYIEASPTKQSSTSIAVTRTFLDAYRASRAVVVDRLDLWDCDLPPFDAEMIEAKFAVLRARNATPAQQAKWAQAVALSQRFNAADKYVFSLPMWNFGIPYRLKHFIDVVTLPGQNWTLSRAEGYRPLLRNKKALLVYTSAGDYPVGPDYAAEDFQKPYMRQWLRFIGVTDLSEVAVAPTLTSPEALQSIKTRAVRQLAELSF